MDPRDKLFYQISGFFHARQLYLSRHLDGIKDFAFEDSLSPDLNQNVFGDLVIAPRLRLGKKAEVFFEHLLTDSVRYEIIGKGIQVIESGTTLGELDFIIKDRSKNTFIHLELASKFYLYENLRGVAYLDQWIGPNKKDRLSFKVRKLKDRQFPLIHHPVTKKLLLDRIGHLSYDRLYQALYFKAFLFVPYLMFDSWPAYEIDGFYVNLRALEKLNHQTEQMYYIPEKSAWFMDPKFHHHWFDFHTILPSLTSYLSSEFSPLIWIKDINGKSSRVFVTWW